MEAGSVQMNYLSGSKGLVGFRAFAVAELNGNARFDDGTQQNLGDLEAFLQSKNGKPGVSALEGQSILYSVPIWQEGAVCGVLAGVLDKTKMQNLLEGNAFGGNGVSCIIDRNFNVVISPREMHFFNALDEVFQKHDDQKTISEIEQMMENIKNRKDGNISFTTVDGKRVLMSYNALSDYDWTLLTIVPSNFISSQTNLHLLTTLTIAFFTILTFVIIIAAMLFNWKKYRTSIEHVAYVDPVTGDMNIYRFFQKAKLMIKSMPPSSYYMVSLNLKAFKLINDQFGREEGDRALRYIFDVIKRNLEEGELAVRAKADNFFLCMKAGHPKIVQERLDKIVGEIKKTDSSSIASHVTVLQGACLITDPDDDINDIADRAEIARKNQTADKEGVCFFYNETLIEKLQMEHELAVLMEPSLENGDFKVYLQPKVRLSDRKTAGAEALVRWEHPKRGMIFPSDFIPVFEKNGAICKLDLFVFEQVCKLLKGKIERGGPVLPISVNLSRQHFRNPNFLLRFEQIKNEYQIPGGLIELELTESIVFDGGEFSMVKDMVRRMHEIGFLCSLDDFGFGYSSLGLLSELEVDAIKLDRIFFDNKAGQRAEWVVEAIISLAKKLNIKTVAEGIESISQLDFLESVHCDLVQGYVFSKPLPADEFYKWAKENDA